MLRIFAPASNKGGGIEERDRIAGKKDDRGREEEKKKGYHLLDPPIKLYTRSSEAGGKCHKITAETFRKFQAGRGKYQGLATTTVQFNSAKFPSS